MGTYTELEKIKYPAMNIVYSKGGFSKQNIIDGNVKMLNSIKNKFDVYISKWGKLLEIDNYIIACFIAVESGGKENLGPNVADATGLCQVTRVNIREVIPKFKAITKTSLPEEISEYLKKKAPYLLSKDFLSSQKLSPSNMTNLSKLLKSDNEFNILMGALSLRWLMEMFKLNDEASVAKILLAYNQSPYGRVQKYKKTKVTAEELYLDNKFPGTKIPKETRDYLAKLLGKNGFIELAMENKIY